MEQALFPEPAPGWENKHRSIAAFCIPSIIKANHNRGWTLFQLLSTVMGEITILVSWVIFTKVITIFSTNNVVKVCCCVSS